MTGITAVQSSVQAVTAIARSPRSRVLLCAIFQSMFITVCIVLYLLYCTMYNFIVAYTYAKCDVSVRKLVSYLFVGPVSRWLSVTGQTDSVFP